MSKNKKNKHSNSKRRKKWNNKPSRKDYGILGWILVLTTFIIMFSLNSFALTLNDNVLRYYSMTDASDMTNYGVSFLPGGIIGNYADFPQTNSEWLKTPLQLNSSGEWTIAGYFYIEANKLKYYNLLYAQRTTYANLDFELYHDANTDKLNLWLGENAAQQITFNTVVTKQQWHFIALTFNWTANTVTLYVDGQSETVSLTTGWSTDGYLGLGHLSDDLTANDYFFYGRMDELYFYNRALNNTELNELKTRIDNGESYPFNLNQNYVDLTNYSFFESMKDLDGISETGQTYTVYGGVTSDGNGNWSFPITSGSYVKYTGQTILDPTKSNTIDLVFKIDPNTDNTNGIIRLLGQRYLNGNEWTQEDVYYDYDADTTNNRGLLYYTKKYRDVNGNIKIDIGYNYYIDNNKIMDGNFHRITIVTNVSNPDVKTYLDNVLLNVNTYTNTYNNVVINNYGDFFIGAILDSESYDYYFDGLMSDLCVWNYAFNQTELDSLNYYRSQGKKCNQFKSVNQIMVEAFDAFNNSKIKPLNITIFINGSYSNYENYYNDSGTIYLNHYSNESGNFYIQYNNNTGSGTYKEYIGNTDYFSSLVLDGYDSVKNFSFNNDYNVKFYVKPIVYYIKTEYENYKSYNGNDYTDNLTSRIWFYCDLYSFNYHLTETAYSSGVWFDPIINFTFYYIYNSSYFESSKKNFDVSLCKGTYFKYYNVPDSKFYSANQASYDDNGLAVSTDKNLIYYNKSNSGLSYVEDFKIPSGEGSFDTYTFMKVYTDTFNKIRYSNNSENVSFVSDLYPPNIVYSFNSDTFGFFNITPSNNLYVKVYDNISSTLYCNFTFNNNNYNNVNFVNGSNVSYSYDYVDSDNIFYSECSDLLNHKSVKNESKFYYLKKLNLVYEENGTTFKSFDVMDRLRFISDNYTYNLLNYNDTTIYFLENKDTSFRLEKIYSTSPYDLLYIDLNNKLLNGSETLCVAYPTQFYEITLYSSYIKPVTVINNHAKCLLLSDYTKYAYQDAYMNKIFTTKSVYYLYTWINNVKTFLASIDGSVATSINLDLLQTNKQYNFDLRKDTITTYKVDNTTIEIYYYNPNKDNKKTHTTIKSYDETKVYFDSWEYDTPNDYKIVFNFATLNLSNDSFIKVKVEKYGLSGEYKGFIENTVSLNGSVGNLDPGLAIIISIVLFITGITILSVRAIFSFFGILIVLASIGILALAPNTPYVYFMMVTYIIIGMFITYIYRSENKNLV